jgi:primosomal protein N' (replication factor Y)
LIANLTKLNFVPNIDPKFYLNIAISVPVNSLFDYLPEANTKLSDYELGMRISVPFGKSLKTGILISISNESTFSDKQLKPISKRLDEQSLLSEHELTLMNWAADYYHHSIGDVFAHAFPKQLRKGESAVRVFPKLFKLTKQGHALTQEDFKRSPRQATIWSRLHQASTPVEQDIFVDIEWDWKTPLKRMAEKGIVETMQHMPHITQAHRKPDFSANAAQLSAIDNVMQAPNTFHAYLLDGVTGSGKTEVYLQLIQKMLEQDKQVLVLLPEITLTPQLATRFRDLDYKLCHFFTGSEVAAK